MADEPLERACLLSVGGCGADVGEPCKEGCKKHADWTVAEPVPHEGADVDWSPLADIKPVLGPELPVDEYAGFWEIIIGKSAHSVPSLVEMVGILSRARENAVKTGENLRIEVYWRVP